MTLAYWCVFAAFILPYAFTLYAKRSGGKFGPEENRDPRAYLARLEGRAKRANSVQLNSFEVNPMFAAAVIIAHQIGRAPQATMNGLAVTFVLSRILFGVLYVTDRALLRSLVWFVGIAAIAAFFFISA